MLVVKTEFAVDVFFLIFECDGRSLLSYVVKIWNKKEPQRVIHTMAHQSKISYFSSDTGSFHSKGQNRQIASFFCTQKPFFEKARKTEIKREKRRKTCVFRGASFLYALRGGSGGMVERRSASRIFTSCCDSSAFTAVCAVNSVCSFSNIHAQLAVIAAAKSTKNEKGRAVARPIHFWWIRRESNPRPKIR